MSVFNRFKAFFFPNTFQDKQLAIDESEKVERVKRLTTEERKTYLLFIQGFTLKEMVSFLGKKKSVVSTHRKSIYKKLGVSSRRELIIGYRHIK